MEKISLLIPIEKKDQAKQIKTPSGGRILWNSEKEEWVWPEPTLPPELEPFRYKGTGPIKDHVLCASQPQYREISNQNFPGGRIRWCLPLQKAIWRGTSLPPNLLPLAAQPGSQETFYGFLLNKPQIVHPKKKLLEIHLSSWDEKPSPNHLTLLENQGLLPLEHTSWLFPESGENQIKSIFQGNIPPICVPFPPTFSYRSREACRLVDLIRSSHHCIIYLPHKLETDPRTTFHCIPHLEKKSKQKLSLGNFPQILQSFGISTALRNFQLHWTPNPEKDIKFLKLLKTP